MSIDSLGGKLAHVPPKMIPTDTMYNHAVNATKRITSYYGDIALNPRYVNEKHLTIIPRRDTLTGEWMWFKQCVSCEHFALYPSDYMHLSQSKRKYYFSNESWLQVLLS